MSSRDSQQTSFLKLTSDPKFIGGTPEYRINALLGMSSPDDVRLLSQFLTEDVKLTSYTQTSATTSSAVFSFRVERFYCNFSGNLHGGAQATFYDVLTSIALQAISSAGSWGNAGVSRSLSVTYAKSHCGRSPHLAKPLAQPPMSRSSADIELQIPKTGTRGHHGRVRC